MQELLRCAAPSEQRAFGSRSSNFLARVPPWQLNEREAPILAACSDAFRRWIGGASVTSKQHMRASKFESRVLEIMGAIFGPAMPVVREVVLPIRVDLALRRLMEDREAGEFQISSRISLRLDFAYLDPVDGGLRVIEADGSQHSCANHFFHGLAGRQSSLPRALRRDMLKDAILANAGVRLLRLGPECERDTHAAKVLILRKVMEFARSSLVGCARSRPPEPQRTDEMRERFMAWAAAIDGGGVPAPTLSLPVRRRSRSITLTSRSPNKETLSKYEERLRQERTAYNRLCRERARQRLRGEQQAAALRLISQRQMSNDSRKRPRDDTGYAYEPRWFKLARVPQPSATGLT